MNDCGKNIIMYLLKVVIILLQSNSKMVELCKNSFSCLFDSLKEQLLKCYLILFIYGRGYGHNANRNAVVKRKSGGVKSVL